LIVDFFEKISDMIKFPSGKRHMKALKQRETGTETTELSEETEEKEMTESSVPTSKLVNPTLTKSPTKVMFGVEGPSTATPVQFLKMLQSQTKQRLNQKMKGDFISAIHFNPVTDISSKETTCVICNMKIKLHINEICSHLLGRNHMRRLLQWQEQRHEYEQISGHQREGQEQVLEYEQESLEMHEPSPKQESDQIREGQKVLNDTVHEQKETLEQFQEQMECETQTEEQPQSEFQQNQVTSLIQQSQTESESLQQSE
jgi:hypothetical protein